MNERLEQVILNLTMSFEKTIPEDEEKRAELISAFKNHLYLAVRTIQESNSKFISKDEASIESTLKGISNDFNKKDLQNKKQELLKDSSFEQIKQISGLAFRSAQDVLNGNSNAIDFDITDKISEVKALLETVESYNREQAQRLVSETILDFRFIENPSNQVSSLRLSHVRRTMGQLRDNNNYKGDER